MTNVKKVSLEKDQMSKLVIQIKSNQIKSNQESSSRFNKNYDFKLIYS